MPPGAHLQGIEHLRLVFNKVGLNGGYTPGLVKNYSQENSRVKPWLNLSLDAGVNWDRVVNF